MADETPTAPGEKESGLKKIFNKVVHHLFSPTMLFMMAAMAFPMIGAAATAAGTSATIGDLGLATIDMYWEMIKAPFTDGGVVGDALTNAFNGEIAPNSYEIGMTDHGNMAGHEGMHSGGEHAGHHINTSGFEEWKNTLSPNAWQEAMDNAKFYGMTPEQYFQNLGPSHE